ncbi:MAG: phosphoribosylaminoimidazolesuccinocarboxamide synthase [Halorhodospira halophila]|uniref:phosphoribosylaminoimidazolesuccinocarboxamide synthase n=1 Tax=Halorhodospira TaxID=85108 RepID=UPI0019140B20|nr:MULTISPECIES: phosphoribosylaminoimidazolesuccinocarboxamide synthase [Halorhodospira]MBK5935389.1 phosphoribosylaminoimidazolesuccinocarboxamide synthase [Halorhodospira halophila]MBK5943237.1 phosphoribosylaminoimidazolesuccinocarboxamide synthase [Halorhodospira halophila]MCC3751608.1 phosphoribosylaminoimidazolesuccinocarboxamide synthase [Halorhodospira halophila]MCG5526759.1 phosphoribosylaminoimidazolesuccinocarboxamide synthase [Halorhodospira halophila]MCG5533813.1 phosphoribosylam
MTTSTPVSQTRIQSLPLLHSGKVRDIYAVDDQRLLIVATDRLSAFDVILPDPIPDKGAVLTRVSNFWFRKTGHLAANHLLDTPPESVVAPEEADQVRERGVVVRRLQALPVEAIVRGYLAGSGWQSYQQDGTVSGVALPGGLRQSDRLPEPIFTPTTKAAVGDHDEPISFAQTVELIGADLAERIRTIALEIFALATEHAEARGLIIADTKLEFGVTPEGEPVIIDELLTPDSSRFWPADAWQPGTAPPAFDKQYIRDHLEALGWDKRPPAPHLSDDVIRRTADKYREAERLLTR